MRITLLIAAFAWFYVAIGQNQRYFDLLDRTERDSFVVRPATTASLNIIDFDKQGYEGVILQELNSSRQLKGRDAFKIDSTFAQVCNTGAKHFPASFFRTTKHKYKVLKHTEFGIRHLRGHHRLFKVYTYNVNLTHLSRFTPFFYHSKDETTTLKLFSGRRPSTLNPDHPDYETPVPVEPILETELAAGVQRLLRQNDGAIEFFSKAYTHIGISVRVDEFTINRHKIPHAFIMVIIGGKQTQKVVIKEPVRTDNADENNPYTILK